MTTPITPNRVAEVLNFITNLTLDKDESKFQSFITCNSISEAEILELTAFKSFAKQIEEGKKNAILFNECINVLIDLDNESELIWDNETMNNVTNMLVMNCQEQNSFESNLKLINEVDAILQLQKPSLRSMKSICHPLTKIYYEKVTVYVIQRVSAYKVWRHIRDFHNNPYPPIILDNDRRIDYKRWASAKVDTNFLINVAHIISNYMGYPYTLVTSASRTFHCTKCFNCLSMMRYNVSYHRTKKDAENYYNTFLDFGIRDRNKIVKEKRKICNNEEDTDEKIQSDFLLVTIEILGEHRSWYKEI